MVRVGQCAVACARSIQRKHTGTLARSEHNLSTTALTAVQFSRVALWKLLRSVCVAAVAGCRLGGRCVFVAMRQSTIRALATLPLQCKQLFMVSTKAQYTCTHCGSINAQNASDSALCSYRRGLLLVRLCALSLSLSLVGSFIRYRTALCPSKSRSFVWHTDKGEVLLSHSRLHQQRQQQQQTSLRSVHFSLPLFLSLCALLRFAELSVLLALSPTRRQLHLRVVRITCPTLGAQ